MRINKLLSYLSQYKILLRRIIYRCIAFINNYSVFINFSLVNSMPWLEVLPMLMPANACLDQHHAFNVKVLRY